MLYLSTDRRDLRVLFTSAVFSERLFSELPSVGKIKLDLFVLKKLLEKV